MGFVYPPFITGTAAYGPFKHSESDIDICMVYDEVQIMRETFASAGFEIEDGKIKNPEYEGFSVNIAGRKFQFICVVPDDDYMGWLWATNQMKRLRVPIRDHDQRIQKFREFYKQWGESLSPDQMDLFLIDMGMRD